MSTGVTIVLVVAAVIVLGLVGWIGWNQLRRRQLRNKFGPEYDRAIEDGQDRRAVERELLEREKRHAELDIRPLDPAERERYAQQWRRIQAEFVDDPHAAVQQADQLVVGVMRERGYPTEGYEEQASVLSVRHAGAVGHYRSAHDLLYRNGNGNGRLSTEELREAMVHYRAMFEDLVTDGGDRADQAERRDHATQSTDR